MKRKGVRKEEVVVGDRNRVRGEGGLKLQDLVVRWRTI